MRLTVAEPSLFEAVGPLVILDRGGRPFYVHDSPGRVSLPAGAYLVAKGSLALVGPVLRPFPPDVPLDALPDRFRVYVQPSADKAHVNTRTGCIYVDPQVMRLPRVALTFVLLHEMGHYFHRTEEGADSWASRTMYALGFNPSQIHAAAVIALSGCERKNLTGALARKLASDE